MSPAIWTLLLIIHGLEHPTTVTLPRHEGVDSYELLWDSNLDTPPAPDAPAIDYAPGTELMVAASSLQLFRAT